MSQTFSKEYFPYVAAGHEILSWVREELKKAGRGGKHQKKTN